MGHSRKLFFSVLYSLLSGCVSENCRKFNCEKIDYPIQAMNLAGTHYGVDTVSADSFAVIIFSGKSESENAGSSAKGATGVSDCATCIQQTTLTHLTFSVDVAPPGRDTVKADSNFLTVPQPGADFYECIFNREHTFTGNQVRVTYRLLVNDSVARTGHKDFVIIP
jgi:hypothetical protein